MIKQKQYFTCDNVQVMDNQQGNPAFINYDSYQQFFRNQFTEKNFQEDLVLQNDDLIKNQLNFIRNHPYLKFYFQDNRKIDLILYELQKDDTLDGISLTYNINLSVLKDLNSISDHSLNSKKFIIIPQKKQKDKKDQKDSVLSNFQLQKFSKLEERDQLHLDPQMVSELQRNLQSSSELADINALQIKLDSPLQTHQFKYPVYYCTSSGDIKGVIIFDRNSLRFDSDSNVQHFKVLDGKKNLFKINNSDITDVFHFFLPKKKQIEEKLNKKDSIVDKDYYIQLNLKNTGNLNFEKQNEKVLTDLKDKNIPYAFIFLRIIGEYNNKQPIPDSIQQAQAKEIEAKYQQILSEISEKPDDSIFTYIPYYDIKAERFQNQKAHYIEDQMNLQNIKVIEDIAYDDVQLSPIDDFTSKMISESNIMNFEIFKQIISNLSPMLRVKNWKLLYSNMVHGSSLNTLYRNTFDTGSNILLIKDVDGVVFGAFCNQSIEVQKEFYGTGESFLFTFKHKKKIECNLWTNMNDYFIYSDNNGIGIGMGDRYGLFIDSDLNKGFSYPSDTFANDILTENIDFIIDYLEIWGIEDPSY